MIKQISEESGTAFACGSNGVAEITKHDNLETNEKWMAVLGEDVFGPAETCTALAEQFSK